METSPSIKELADALCKFQSNVTKVTKAKTNPAFKSKYSDVTSILEAVLPALTEVGLAVIQFPDGEHTLTTRLQHVSGEYMQASYPMKPAMATPQGIGSAMTYARRYALVSILALGAEDDDGHAASQQPKVVAAPPPTPTENTTPVQYATAAQKEKILELLNHPLVTRQEKQKMILNINRLDEERADQAIKKLNKAIEDREGTSAVAA